MNATGWLFIISIALIWFACFDELRVRNTSPNWRADVITLGAVSFFLAVIPLVGILWYAASRRSRGAAIFGNRHPR